MASAMRAAVSALTLDKCSTSAGAFANSSTAPQASLRYSPAAVPASGTGSFKFVRIQHHHQIHQNHHVLSRKPSLLRTCNSAPSDDSRSSSSSNSTSTSTSSPPSVEGSRSEEARGEASLPPPRPQGRRRAGSTDWISSSLTRRFGLAGGLAWVGFLAFGVVSEQIKTRTEVFRESQDTQDVENATEVTLENNVRVVDLRTGGGASPLRGDVVLIDLVGRVRSTGKVFVDTVSAKGRSLAFVYGLRPYPRGVCYGLEYALKSMRAGGKRKVVVPADQCFGDAGEDFGGGVAVPPGEEVEFEVQLERVSIAPS